MPSRGRGRGRGGSGGSSGRPSTGISKSSGFRGYKKPSARGGSKRGRVKSVPDPPKIIGLKSRKAELSISFKIIGSYQKAALLALAQKSLDDINNDVTYHRNLPEFRKVTEELDDHLICLLLKLKARRRYEEELARRRLEQNIEIINQQYKIKLEDLKDHGIAKIQENILYVEKMSRMGCRIEQVPFSRGEDGRKITKLAAPPKIVHPVAVPFLRCQPADEKSVYKIGDNLLEQHPANFWMSCTEAQKKAISSQQLSIIEANQKIAQDEKCGIYKKRTATASSLFNPAVVPSIEMDVDEDDLQLDEPVISETTVQDDQNQVLEFSDDAAELPLDPYGVRIPRKKFRATSKARPNNHMVVPRVFDFQDAEGQVLEDGSIGIQEIGFRNWTTKNIRNRDYFIGSDTSPNPEFFFIPQRVGDVNSGNNTIEDMRSVAHIIRTHKLHPTLGIVLPGSINPDYTDLEDPYFPPPTDRNLPLEPLKPHVFIQNNIDGTITVSKIPRSWTCQTNEDFKDLGLRNKIADLLTVVKNYTNSEKDLANSCKDSPDTCKDSPDTCKDSPDTCKDSPDTCKNLSDTCKNSGSIDEYLVSAVMAALEDKSSEKVAAEGKNISVQPPVEATSRQNFKSISSKPSPKANQRSSRLQYDPVRDSFPVSPRDHWKPLSRIEPQISKQEPSHSSERSMLNELADHASCNPKLSSDLKPAQKDLPTLHTSIPQTPSYYSLLPHPQKVQQTMHPPIDIKTKPINYHDISGSTQSLKSIISPQVPQCASQQHVPNQSTISAPSYQMRMFPPKSTPKTIYPSYSSPQVTFASQVQPQTNYAPHASLSSTYTCDSSTAASYVPPILAPTNYNRSLNTSNYNPHPPSQAIYQSQSPPQPTQICGGLESSNFREIRQASLQRPSPVPFPPLPTFSWRTSGNFHSHSYPK